jgi:hypothetical protein
MEEEVAIANLPVIRQNPSPSSPRNARIRASTLTFSLTLAFNALWRLLGLPQTL